MAEGNLFENLPKYFFFYSLLSSEELPSSADLSEILKNGPQKKAKLNIILVDKSILHFWWICCWKKPTFLFLQFLHLTLSDHIFRIFPLQCTGIKKERNGTCPQFIFAALYFPYRNMSNMCAIASQIILKLSVWHTLILFKWNLLINVNIVLMNFYLWLWNALQLLEIYFWYGAVMNLLWVGCEELSKMFD